MMRRLILALLLPLCSHATIVQVGHAFSAATAAGNSKTVTYAPTTGNSVFVFCSAWNVSGLVPSSESVSDGAHNAYALQKSFNGTGSLRMTLYLHGAANVTGGSFTYTCNASGGGNTWWLNIFVAEYSGLATTLTLDGACSSATAGSSGTSLSISPIVTTHAVDLLLAAWGMEDNNGTITLTPTSGFSVVDSQLDANCCTESGLMRQIVTVTGSYTAGYTRSPAGVGSIIECTFKGPPVTKVRTSVQ